MRTLTTTLPCLTLALTTAATHADVHFDIAPVLQAGQIVTHGVTHASTTNPWTGNDTSPTSFNYYQPQMRVFGYELGEEPLFPRATEDPGINNQPGSYLTEDGSTINLTGTGLPLNSTLSFIILSDLQYWNGTSFTVVPNGESMTITYGSTRTVGTGTGTLAPLTIKTFTSNSNIHLHMDAELFGSPDPENPSIGVYMFSAQLKSSSPLVADSLPFWIVYNFGDTEEVHEAAIEFVQANLVPEPVSLSVLAVGSVTLLLRRRRQA